jgi:hypothetical protein
MRRSLQLITLLCGMGLLMSPWNGYAQISFSINEIPSLAAVAPTAMKTGDYDQDGDPDLLLQYFSGSWQARIYTNTSTASTISFASTSHVFSGASTFVDWVDYNKDGFLDVLINGAGASAIYLQNGASFTVLSASLPGTTSFNYFELADTNNDAMPELIADRLHIDYDKDGDLDYFKSGVYTNRDNTFIETHTFWDGFDQSQRPNRLPGVILDFDNNGEPDIAYIERNAKDQLTSAMVLLNNGGVFTKRQLDNFALSSGALHIAGYGDFNSNGKPEIIVYANTTNFFGVRDVTFIEYNTPNPTTVFTLNYPINTYEADMTSSCIADFNGDGKLDLLAYHQYGDDFLGPVTKFYSYRNLTAVSNTNPTAPAGLTSSVSGGHVTLTWARATDGQTSSQGITYNLEVKNGIDNLVSANSLPSGKLLTNRLGNVQQANSVVLNLPNGRYDWSVSAVDGHNLSGIKSTVAQFEVTQSFDQPQTSTLGQLQTVPLNDSRIVLAGQQGGDIYFQFLDKYGSRISQLTKVNTSTVSNTVPRVAYNPTQNHFLILWKGTSGIQAGKLWGRVFSTTGTAASAEFQVSEPEATVPGSDLFDYDVVYNDLRSHYRIAWTFGFDAAGTVKTRTINATTFALGAVATHRNAASFTESIYHFDYVRLGITDTADRILLAYSTRDYPFDPSPPDRYTFVESLTTDFTGGPPVRVNAAGIQSIAFNPYDTSFALAYEAYTYRNTDVAEVFIETSEVRVDHIKPATFPLIQKLGNVSESFVQGGQGGAYTPRVAHNRRRNEWLVLWKNTEDQKIHGRKINGHTHQVLGVEEFVLTDYTGSVTDLEYATADNQHFLTAGNLFNVVKLPKDAPPVVTGLRTDEAYAGDTLTIFGTGFGNTPYLNTVKFGSITAAVDTVFFSTTKLRVTVPNGLTRDRVPVTVSFDDQVSNNTVLFENLSLQAVTSINASEAERGDLITITGERFVTDPALLTVLFGSVPSQPSDIVSLTTTEIQVTVPQAALRGTWPVTVVIQDQPVDAPTLLRIIVAPVITSVTAPNGFISCNSVVISGENFSNDAQQLLITFGDVPVSTSDIIAVSPTTLNVAVPKGAEGDLPIRVSIDDRMAETAPQPMYLGASLAPASPAPPSIINLSQRDDDGVNFYMLVRSECSITEARVWTKGISAGNSAWTSQPLELVNERGDIRLEEESFTDPLGLNLFYEIDDVSGITVYSDTFFIQPRFTELDSTNHIPDMIFGGSVADYNIIALPFTLSPNNIPSVFRDLVNNHGSDSSKWRLYHYLNDATQDRYIEYTRGLNTVEAGRGYWMIVRYPQDIFIDGAQAVDVSGGPFEITLQPGWNQVGNPYDFNVSWTDVLSFNNNPANLESLKVFEDGAFKQSNVLQRYRGGFVKYNGSTPLVLRIPYTKNNSINGGRVRSTPAADLSADSWFIPLTLSTPSVRNEALGFGIDLHAQDGVDTFDEHRMPRFFNQVDMSFTHDLATSVQVSEANKQWDFTVHNATGEDRMTLTWKIENFGNNTKGIFLFDRTQQVIVNMRETNRYIFQYSPSNAFTIWVGEQAYLEENMRPEQVVLGEAFPNPFTTETSIPFTVVRDRTQVKITVFTMQGQPVTTLVNNVLDAGFYEATLKRHDGSGRPLAPGTYVYQLQTIQGSSQVLQTRRVLIH